MSTRRSLLAANAVAAALVAVLVAGRPAEAIPPVALVIPTVPAPLVIEVAPDGRTGTQSVMGQRVMYQEPRTSGPSADRLAFHFTQPAQIMGVLVSVDIAGPQLVELVVDINPEGVYGVKPELDGDHRPFSADGWLLHVSDVNTGASKIDESIWFGADGPSVQAGDVVAVDSWLGNERMTREGISPEIIVFYRWADA